MKTFTSQLSQENFPIQKMVLGNTASAPILELIKKDHPDFDPEQPLSIDELNSYREKYISNLLEKEINELQSLRKTVVESSSEPNSFTEKIEREDISPLTYGQKLADRVAAFGGSWSFILLFGFIVVAWIVSNAFWMQNKGFDPYPFILLNLILSCIAALQAPIIMMSQNRQEEKDRERSKKDYLINLKSELEIRTLHEKMDHLIMHQQQELIEIQKVQIDMLRDILKRVK
jgi:uncharacterized membrane protein